MTAPNILCFSDSFSGTVSTLQFSDDYGYYSYLHALTKKLDFCGLSVLHRLDIKHREKWSLLMQRM